MYIIKKEFILTRITLSKLKLNFLYYSLEFHHSLTCHYAVFFYNVYGCELYKKEFETFKVSFKLL